MFLQLPSSSLKSHHPSPFLHGSSLLPRFSPPSSFAPSPAAPPPALTIRAMKTMQGRVVCAASDKTVAVEVTRLAPHPKYKRRVRKKKTYQAHDPDNRFKVGDVVQLEKCRPISKTKTFLANPVVGHSSRRTSHPDTSDALNLPLESQQQETA